MLIMRKTFLALIIFIICPFLFCGVSYAKALSISLEGQHRFHSGDDRIWASYDYDDSGWQQIDVPGSWQTKGVIPEDGKGWYRIHFFLPEDFKGKDLAVLLGNIGNMNQTFLNGVKIGGTDDFDKWLLDSSNVEQLFRLPQDLLKFNSVNVLAVRVMSFYWHGGILKGPLEIGEYNYLLAGRLKRDFFIKAQEIIFILFFLLALTTCFFFCLQGVKRPELFYFAGMLVSILVAHTIETLIFYETGFKNVYVQNLSLFFYVMVPVNFLFFLMKFFRFEFTRFFKAIIFFGITLAVLLGLFGTYNYSVYTLLSGFWLIQLILTGAAVAIIVTKAYRNKMENSKTILISIFLLMTAVVIEILAICNFLPFENSYIEQYPVLLFILVVLFAFIQRHMQLNTKNRLLSGRILHAYEDERKRLSRELHDGLGQSLLAIKLDLQRVNQNENNPVIDKTIGELSEGIEQLRDISQGLHPPFLEDMGLAAAVELYGNKFYEKTGIEVSVRADYLVRQPAAVEENLFRIFQEALSNTVKHSNANRVIVSLNYSKGAFVMKISDNGEGFDYENRYSSCQGQGLRTMKERVDLIGSVLKCECTGGTTIQVEVPFS